MSYFYNYGNSSLIHSDLSNPPKPGEWSNDEINLGPSEVKLVQGAKIQDILSSEQMWEVQPPCLSSPFQ